MTESRLVDTRRFFAPATHPVDFEEYDQAAGCAHCPTWRAGRVRDETGVWVWREWHQPTCPAVADWLDDGVPVAKASPGR